MIILGLLSLCLFFWLCYQFTAVILKLAYILIIGIPLAVLLFAAGVILCCTILLIPAGKALIAVAGRVLYPF